MLGEGRKNCAGGLLAVAHDDLVVEPVGLVRVRERLDDLHEVQVRLEAQGELERHLRGAL